MRAASVIRTWKEKVSPIVPQFAWHREAVIFEDTSRKRNAEGVIEMFRAAAIERVLAMSKKQEHSRANGGGASAENRAKKAAKLHEAAQKRAAVCRENGDLKRRKKLEEDETRILNGEDHVKCKKCHAETPYRKGQQTVRCRNRHLVHIPK